MTPETELADPLHRLADAHCVVRKHFAADFLAVAWYNLAPLPTGRWAVQFGGWCQGVGTVDHPWDLYHTQAECLGVYRAAVRELCTREVSGLSEVQAKARRKLLGKLAIEDETVSLPPPGRIAFPQTTGRKW